MHPLPSQPAPHSNAWLAQTWISFVLAVGFTSVGIVYLPVTAWIRAYLTMGMLFSVASTVSLSKTLRDTYEAQKLVARVDEARVERLLVDHHPLK
jgi:hypothetical protein